MNSSHFFDHDIGPHHENSQHDGREGSQEGNLEGSQEGDQEAKREAEQDANHDNGKEASQEANQEAEQDSNQEDYQETAQDGQQDGQQDIDRKSGKSVDETNPNDSKAKEDSLRDGCELYLGDLFAELQSIRPNNESLHIPASHPLYTKIIDTLAFSGIEILLRKRWDEQLEALKAYKDEHGSTNVPLRHPALGRWVHQQRQHYDLHKSKKPSLLTKKRIQKLKDVGFQWRQNRWEQRLDQLAEYKRAHGHCDVPIEYPKLGIWVLNQRFNLKDMPQDRIDALDQLGFIWNWNRVRSDEAWNAQYNALLEYKRLNGHCNVYSSYRHSRLGTWVGKQRDEYKKFMNKQSSQLSRNRIEKLNEIGFVWKVRGQSWQPIPWDDRFEELKKFKMEHGHCNIPRDHAYFGNWPNYQRAQYRLFRDGKPAKITKEKVDKLIEIGFLESQTHRQQTRAQSRRATRSSRLKSRSSLDQQQRQQQSIGVLTQHDHDSHPLQAEAPQTQANQFSALEHNQFPQLSERNQEHNSASMTPGEQNNTYWQDHNQSDSQKYMQDHNQNQAQKYVHDHNQNHANNYLQDRPDHTVNQPINHNIDQTQEQCQTLRDNRDRPVDSIDERLNDRIEKTTPNGISEEIQNRSNHNQYLLSLQGSQPYSLNNTFNNSLNNRMTNSLGSTLTNSLNVPLNQDGNYLSQPIQQDSMTQRGQLHNVVHQQQQHQAQQHVEGQYQPGHVHGSQNGMQNQYSQYLGHEWHNSDFRMH